LEMMLLQIAASRTRSGDENVGAVVMVCAPSGESRIFRCIGLVSDGADYLDSRGSAQRLWVHTAPLPVRGHPVLRIARCVQRELPVVRPDAPTPARSARPRHAALRD